MAAGKDKDAPKESFSDRLANQWRGFSEFMYDPNTKTVMGRSGKSWAKILIFYLFYYGFLAALFAVSISIVRGTLDEFTPTYQTRLQTPGVGVQPKIASNVEQTSNIFYTVPETAPDTNNVPYTRLVEQVETFLKPYNASLQMDVNSFQNCSDEDPMQLNQQFNGKEQMRSCAFNTSLLGPCGTYPYGYDVGKPCIYVKLNRIINWYPVGYTDISAAGSSSESMAPSLSSVLEKNGQTYKPNLMYTTCYGYTDEDKTALNDDFKYYPESMGLPFSFYPYHGKQRQPSYLNPLVAVQLNNVTRGTKIDMACKVYAMNIQDNKDMGEGFFRFDLQID